MQEEHLLIFGAKKRLFSFVRAPGAAAGDMAKAESCKMKTTVSPSLMTAIFVFGKMEFQTQKRLT
jgi:hypothetical protein